MGWDFHEASHKGEVFRRHREKQARKQVVRERRAARRAERTAAGVSGPDIDWSAALDVSAETDVAGVVRTIARGEP